MDAKEAKARLKAGGHKVAYCTFCATPTIRCGKCGNNSCNGGTSPNGCPDDCKEAYEISEAIRFPVHLRLMCRAQWGLFYAVLAITKLWRKIHDPED